MIIALLYWVGFGSIALPVLLGPWLFGAWEMWWFWPFVVTLAVAAATLAIRFLAVAAGCTDRSVEAGARMAGSMRSLILTYLLFLVYAVVRVIRTDVYLDAERSLLLFVMPFLVAVYVVFGLTRRHARWLYWAVFVNLCLLALYGVGNHVLDGSRLVMWAPRYDQYAGRATGSYFCPDHYSGICELLAALCLGLVFARQTRQWLRGLAGAFVIVAVAGVLLSQSRGGGLTLVVMAGAVFVCGMWQWPSSVRWYSRGAIVCGIALALLLSAPLTKPYVTRFVGYVDTGSSEQTFRERCDKAGADLLNTPRGRMIPAALRSWRSAPVWGIGPGMHRNVWPHIAPTADGDRAANRWPSQINHHFHSYEVHSDWVQLLQEYGAVGLVLLLAATAVAFALFWRGMRHEVAECADAHWVQPDNPNYCALLGGALALLAMVFHSLGDFNLQMPATTWIFGAILAIAFRAAVWDERERSEAP